MTRGQGAEAMRKIKEEFVKRAVGHGVPEDEARKVFDWMEGFSVYGFSVAHAASFASLSYASAYIRCHHPAEFFCALLNSRPMGFYSPRVLLNEARRVGIEILPPDIMRSGNSFTVERKGKALRVGLSYCKTLSTESASSIVSERRKRPFVSVADLYRRTWVERDSLKNLIKGGFLNGPYRTGKPTVCSCSERPVSSRRNGPGTNASRRFRCPTRRAGGRRGKTGASSICR